MNEKPKRPNPKSVWTAPFLWTEWAMEWIVYTLSRLAIIKFLEFAGRFAVVVAVILFFTEAGERARNARYAAWQVINSAQGQPGSGGRIDAMQYLAFRGVSMRGLSAPGAMLQKIKLPGATLTRADLPEANLSGADLRGAILWGANLRDANLRSADLSKADLSGADLREAELGGANLEGASLPGANLRGAGGLNVDTIRSSRLWQRACYDERFRKKLGIEEEPPRCERDWGEVQP